MEFGDEGDSELNLAGRFEEINGLGGEGGSISNK